MKVLNPIETQTVAGGFDLRALTKDAMDGYNELKKEGWKLVKDYRNHKYLKTLTDAEYLLGASIGIAGKLFHDMIRSPK